jgi:hypothetical protein
VVEAETSDSPVVFSWVCHLVWGALANYPDWEAGILEIISHNSGGEQSHSSVHQGHFMVEDYIPAYKWPTSSCCVLIGPFLIVRRMERHLCLPMFIKPPDLLHQEHMLAYSLI